MIAKSSRRLGFFGLRRQLEWCSSRLGSASRKRPEEALRESENQSQHLSFQLLSAQENEGKSVAQTLHDSIGQTSAAIKPTLDDLGILATTSWFCREFQTIYSEIRIERHMDTHEDDVPDPLKTIIYRILKEALDNVEKTARQTWCVSPRGRPIP